RPARPPTLSFMFISLAMRCRKQLAAAGVSPAAGLPASYAFESEAVIRPARLIEDTELQWHAPGDASAFDEPVAFLDGTQRTELLGYAGAAPLMLAEVRAAVRER